jgi:hypothetical protein
MFNLNYVFLRLDDDDSARTGDILDLQIRSRCLNDRSAITKSSEGNLRIKTRQHAVFYYFHHFKVFSKLSYCIMNFLPYCSYLIISHKFINLEG